MNIVHVETRTPPGSTRNNFTAVNEAGDTGLYIEAKSYNNPYATILTCSMGVTGEGLTINDSGEIDGETGYFRPSDQQNREVRVEVRPPIQGEALRLAATAYALALAEINETSISTHLSAIPGDLSINLIPISTTSEVHLIPRLSH